MQNTNTPAPTGDPRFTGGYLDKEYHCVAKLIAARGITIGEITEKTRAQVRVQVDV